MAYSTASDTSHETWSDLKSFIEVATEDAEWPNESTLDSLVLTNVKEDSDNNACGVFEFSFTGRIVVTGFHLNNFPTFTLYSLSHFDQSKNPEFQLHHEDDVTLVLLKALPQCVKAF